MGRVAGVTSILCTVRTPVVVGTISPGFPAGTCKVLIHNKAPGITVWGILSGAAVVDFSLVRKGKFAGVPLCPTVSAFSFGHSSTEKNKKMYNNRVPFSCLTEINAFKLHSYFQ